MKKILSFILFVFAMWGLVGCGSQEQDKKPDSTPPPTPPVGDVDSSVANEDISNEDIGFVIHFNLNNKVDEKYRYNLWLWGDGKDGADYQFNGENDYGVFFKMKFVDFSKNLIGKELGFIVKENKTWADGPAKDYDGDRFMDFKTLEKDNRGYYHIWLMTKDKNIYTSPKLEINDLITDASFGEKKFNGVKRIFIWFQTNKKFSNFKITGGNQVLVDMESAKDNPNVQGATSKRVIYYLDEFPDIKENYTVEVKFEESGKTLNRLVAKENLFKTEQFNTLYNYAGELGAIYSKASTTFRVWSPVSSEIKLRIYDNGTPKSVNKILGSDKYTEYPLIAKEKGVWENTINGDLHGKYYTYVVTNANYKGVEIVDPYAKSAGVNGLRGMIVDFAKTNPTGWENISALQIQKTNLAVYETHVADLTSSKTWNGTAENAKKFAGFYETGTKFTKGSTTVSTGFDHIKELGVNAVQLLPIFDSANDEVNTLFNWGYNPLNYNVLDGSFSKNPYDGLERIKEFKELVKAYNEAGINIIMDVVYNHVNGLEKSNFDVLMPHYYFRYSNGAPKNGSGCGNETASEMFMFRKFMIDSTEFWAKEYKLGGFRFDLMGIHDITTMNQLTKNLKDNVNPSIAVYGEPWAAGSINIDNENPANQSNMSLYEGYGCFNDKVRDSLIKGGMSGVKELGWADDKESVNINNYNSLIAGITGNVYYGDEKFEADKAVTYVTCHDNYTLYDRFIAAGITDEDEIKKMAMLANSVVFTSQGISFMLAGEEFLRTKGGSHNSYDRPYEVNELNYELKIKHLDMVENYKKLIALKTKTNLFNKSNAECLTIKIQKNANGSLIKYQLKDGNKTYLIIHSNGVAASDKTVDLTGYTLYLDTLNKEGLELGASTTLDSFQTIIAYK